MLTKNEVKSIAINYMTDETVIEIFYDALFDYFCDEMPYGTAKGRTGDPHNWIANRMHALGKGEIYE